MVPPVKRMLRVAAITLALVASAAVRSAAQHAAPIATRADVRYPPMLYAARVGGDVRAELVVDSSGRAIPATVKLSREGHTLLQSAVRTAVMAWRFEPPPPNGERADTVVLHFSFRAPLARDVQRITSSCADCDAELVHLREAVDENAHSHEVCAHALREIARPGGVDSLGKVFSVLAGCGHPDESAALTLRMMAGDRHSLVTDDLRTRYAESVMAPAVFDAALALAASASDGIRIHALEVLDALTARLPRALSELARPVAPNGRCGAFIVNGVSAPAASLRDAYLARTRDLAGQLASNKKISPSVQQAARCLLEDIAA
jgi:TonB family protein